METLTIERVRAGRAAGPAPVLAYAGAAAFIVAAGWFWLATKNVTVAAPPRIRTQMPPLQGMHIYYRWQVTTLAQERYYTSVAIAAFVCLAAVASFLRDLVARDHPLTRTGALLIGAGAAAWITGHILELGGHRAVGLMATHTNPIQTTNSIAFTIDMIAAAFALAAFAFIGVGMLAFAAAAREQPERRGQRAWAGYTTLVALVMLITAWSYATANSNLSDLVLIADGLVLLPAWLIWSCRIALIEHESRNAV
jgi:hypothetical protein